VLAVYQQINVSPIKVQGRNPLHYDKTSDSIAGTPVAIISGRSTGLLEGFIKLDTKKTRRLTEDAETA
jgi:hypothetical protein